MNTSYLPHATKQYECSNDRFTANPPPLLTQTHLNASDINRPLLSPPLFPPLSPPGKALAARLRQRTPSVADLVWTAAPCLLHPERRARRRRRPMLLLWLLEAKATWSAVRPFGLGWQTCGGALDSSRFMRTPGATALGMVVSPLSLKVAD
jgi:hypothetical protein